MPLLIYLVLFLCYLLSCMITSRFRVNKFFRGLKISTKLQNDGLCNYAKIIRWMKKRIRSLQEDDPSEVWIKEQGIDNPTLFIDSYFRTSNSLILLLDFFTLGLLKLDVNLISVDCPVSLSLYFENLFDSEIKRHKKILFYICYPDGTVPRNWKLNLPALRTRGGHTFAEMVFFFKPELPGDHRLIITRLKRETKQQEIFYQYAGLHGVSGRLVKQIGGDWTSHFHVMDGTQRNLLIIAGLTLTVAILGLVISLTNL